MQLDEPVDLADADLEACARMMRGGSRTFFAASRLLPPRVRAGAIALYAFCRVADDLVDQPGGGAAAVDVLRGRLDRIYAGTPCDCVEDHALALLVQQTGLPRHLLDALLEGFAWDAEGRHYETLASVQAYGARVAGTVGAMMAWVMGARAPDTLARACELGVAMQLTNIARDVGEDARNGRLYLPRAWMREAGLTPEVWLQAPSFSPALQSVVARLLEEADRLYAGAQPGIGALPADCRAAILAASQIYAEIGHQLRREGGDSVTQRTVVSTGRKLVLLAGAWTQAGWIRTAAQPRPGLPAIGFLVEGCHAHLTETQDLSEAAALAVGFPNRSLPQRVEWVLGLLERRERERLERPARRRLHATGA
jgi:phytoene synthase